MLGLERQLVDVAEAYTDSPNYMAMMAAAFHRATDIPPECCALVHVEVDGGDAYYYARILGIDDTGDLQLERVQHLGLLRRQLRKWLEALW